MALKEKRQYWLDGYQGAAKGGAFYRSKIAIEVDEFETKFNQKIVAMAEARHKEGKLSKDDLTEIKLAA